MSKTDINEEVQFRVTGRCDCPVWPKLFLIHTRKNQQNCIKCIFLEDLFDMCYKELKIL